MLRMRQCYPAEQISIYYALLTAAYMVALPGGVAEGQRLPLLLARAAVLAALFALQRADTRRAPRLTFARQVLPLALVLFWYPETYYLNRFFFPNLDALFMQADELLLGGQACIAFSRHMPWAWLNELMNFAYLSFYFIIALTVLASYKAAKAKGYRAAFVVLLSFLVYCLLFIILPVMGPQFYLPPPHNSTPDTWPFRAIMQLLQGWGERPTGAFPSSHVGITVICMQLLYAQKMRKLFWALLPLAALLALSTVYIKAHYVVDVLGGLLTAPFLHRLGGGLWGKMSSSCCAERAPQRRNSATNDGAGLSRH